MNRHERINDAELPSSGPAEIKRFFRKAFGFQARRRLHFTDPVEDEFAVWPDR